MGVQFAEVNSNAKSSNHSTITLCGSDSDLKGANDTRGLLCEFASDSPRLRSAKHYYLSDEMLGSPDEALAVAHTLVSKLIQSFQILKELSLVTILEEVLLEEFSYSVQAFHLDRWIQEHKISVCHFDSYSPWLDRLRQVQTLTESRYTLTAEVPFGQHNWARRGMGRLWKSRGTPSELLRRLAPLYSRYLSAARIRRSAANAPKGGIWFYSTAYNFTKIGLEYEPHFPGEVNFLVEDRQTGGKPLSELGRNSHVLYAWSRASDVPSVSEVRSIGKLMTTAIASIPLENEERALRSVLLKSDWWDHLLKRRLPFLLFHGRVLARWCETVNPEMLIVGNAGWERSLLQSRCAERIPSLMLQHGIMHWVYAVSDQPVTHFLVRGKFFQKLVNDQLRRKTIVCNYPQQKANVQVAPSLRNDVLFITMPYQVAPLFHRGDLRDILRSLLHVSYSVGRRLVIRVHPLEKVSSYSQLVSELQQEAGRHSDVIYSQGPGAEDVLASSRVAVLYFSTMFLDCLRHGIPIISFGWHSFPNKRHFEQAGIFNFASNLSDLEQLVQRAVEGNIPPARAALEDFLAPTRPEEISKILRELWESAERKPPGQEISN